MLRSENELINTVLDKVNHLSEEITQVEKYCNQHKRLNASQEAPIN